jgi:hypothetical protein
LLLFFRLFSLLLLIVWKFAEKKYNNSFACAPRGHEQAIQAGNSHSSAAKYLGKRL